MIEKIDWVKTIKYLSILGTIAICLFIFYLGWQDFFVGPDRLEERLRQMGAIAPVAFLAVQIIQTIIPIIPGGVSSAIGVIVFGPFYGFIYNYIGLLIGSYIAFTLVKRYGKTFMLKVMEQKTYDKYIGWLEKGKKFDLFFAFAILLPGMPDDILCMICGLTNMRTRRFLLINIVCKPFGLLLYSFAMKEVLLFMSRLL
ncbi:TVP38/TMEM64 family protein [Merdibacter massiliensis]|uniref:TVP38/TMEM64 family protein n=1 Tax=Merdibacter massiliensis TaxID=1871030 RepID=UPI00096A5A75|nr:VTT domain-containing protein [Merdibacter massiliensis]